MDDDEIPPDGRDAPTYIETIRSLVGDRLLLLPAVAAVIRDDERRLLLQRKHDGTWSLPAGMIEPGETPLEALVREVREETALLVECERVLDVFGGQDFRHTYPNGHRVEYTVTLFLCRVVDALDERTDEETASIAWFAERDMPTLALPYPIRRLFDDDA